VAQLVEALRYKPEGREFDSRWNFPFTLSYRPHYGPGVESVSNRNEYQEYFLGSKGGRCVGLTTLPPSCAECLEIWEPQTPGTLRAFPGLYRDCFTFYQTEERVIAGMRSLRSQIRWVPFLCLSIVFVNVREFITVKINTHHNEI
jgi:hypothetical protein